MGLVQINGNQFHSALASGIQKGWHRAWGDLMDQYNYIPDENDKKFGVVMAGSLGIQKDLLKTNNCVIRANSNVGQRISTIPGGTFTGVSGGVEIKYYLGPKKKRSLGLNMGTSAQTDFKEIELNANAALTYTTKKVTVFTSFQKPFKNPLGPSKFTDPDMIQRMGVIIPLVHEKKDSDL